MAPTDDIAARFREFVFLDRRRAHGPLSPSEFTRWTLLKRLLGRELQGAHADSRADQRDSLRVPAQLRVSFGSLGELGEALITNLSRGGLFVATSHPLEIGTRVTLHVQLAGEEKDLEVVADVVSQNLGPRGTPQRGLGFRFAEVEGELRKRLDALYERALLAAAPHRR
ncbi:MAG TPA: TIGR02266 family protein [Myxococcota bacterium]|nr:TIGR02266 family protein [Myxococcota bacterium]